MTRLITLSVLAFWVLMTTLLLRLVYFPDHSRYREVPSRLVLKSFLEGGATINTLHVYHKDRKLGHASVSARRLPSAIPDHYRVHLSGVLEKGSLEMIPGQVSWRMDVELENLDTWAGSKGQIRLMDTNMVLDFEWTKGERLPRFTLKEKGVVLADDTSLQPLLAGMLGPNLAGFKMPEGLAMPGGVELPENSDISSFIQAKTQEGRMKIAGQYRQAYLMEFSVMDQWKAKVYFTEAGELALMDLPQGYRFVEPVIYGLVPQYDEDEEIPVPPMEPPPAAAPSSPPAPAPEISPPVKS
jgi:hypothetical protein